MSVVMIFSVTRKLTLSILRSRYKVEAEVVVGVGGGISSESDSATVLH